MKSSARSAALRCLILGCLLACLGAGAQATPASSDETVTLGPFMHQGGGLWTAAAPPSWPSDTVDESLSRLELFEDGVPLGPAHSLHAEIRSEGQGRYSHWAGLVFFATSDGSDPQTNGRTYTVSLRAQPLGQDGYRVLPLRDPFSALPARSLAVGVAGLPAMSGQISNTGEAGLSASSPAAVSAPPLIYWYTIDALRLDVAAARVGGGPLMPTLNELRSEAVSFDRAYVQSSFTKTSTASMFTGLWPQRHGVMHGWVPTWPEGGALFFDLDNRFYTLAEYLGDKGYETWTHRFTIHVQPGAGMLQGFDHIDLATGSDVPVPVVPERLFVYEHILGAHGPYSPSAEAREHLDLPAPSTIDPASTDWFYGPVNDAQIAELSAAYRAEVWDSDRQLAARLAGIRDAGLWDDALIIVTSDHGEEFLDHGATQHSVQLYEEVLRVPLLVKFPAGHRWAERHGDHLDDRVRLVDLFPTMVELLGDDVSELPYALDGHSLGPILEGNEHSAMGREVLARVSFTSVVEETGELALFVTDAVAHGPLKAVLGYRIRSSQDPARRPFAQGDWVAELYDLGNDPRERVELLARGGEYGEAFEFLAGQLARAFAPLSLPGAKVAGPAPGDDGFVESGLTDVLRALGYVGGSAVEQRKIDQR